MAGEGGAALRAQNLGATRGVGKKKRAISVRRPLLRVHSHASRGTRWPKHMYVCGGAFFEPPCKASGAVAVQLV